MKKSLQFLRDNIAALIFATFMTIHGFYGFSKMNEWFEKEQAFHVHQAEWFVQQGRYDSIEEYLNTCRHKNHSGLFLGINLTGAVGILCLSIYLTLDDEE